MKVISRQGPLTWAKAKLKIHVMKPFELLRGQMLIKGSTCDRIKEVFQRTLNVFGIVGGLKI